MQSLGAKVLLVKEERKPKVLRIGGPLRMAHCTTWIPHILCSLKLHHPLGEVLLCLSFTSSCCVACFCEASPFLPLWWRSFFALNRVVANAQTGSRCSTQAVMLLHAGASDFTKCVVKQRCPLLASYWSMDGCHQNIRKSCWVLNLIFLSHGQRSAAARVAPAGFPAHHSHQCHCSAERWTSAVRLSGKKTSFWSPSTLVITHGRFLPMMTCFICLFAVGES